MGNTSSNNKYGNDTEVDTLNWGNFNTEEVSIKEDEYINKSNMPKGLEYLNNLEIPETSEVEASASAVSEKFVASKTDSSLGLPDKLTDITETVSATSPFISSEMYKFVMKGGAENDDSESSATSSSDKKEDKKDNENKSSSSSSHKSEHHEDSSEAHHNSSEAHHESSEDHTQTGGSSVTSASYISSSEHCGGPNSDDEASSVVSTEDRIVSSSLNTSDINLISLKN